MKSSALFCRTLGLVFVVSLLFASLGDAEVPQLIHYQGRVTVEGTNFNGTGQFKFALVNSNATVSFWSNDGTSSGGGAPFANILLQVSRGLYSVLLGDATLANMTILSSTVFTNSDVRLRVWFNDGTHGFQLLTPDQRIAAVGYAMMSANAELADTVKDGAITAAKLAPGAVTEASVADGAISAVKLATNVTVGVPSGGIVLSESEVDTNLLNAGYVRLMPVQMGNVWDVWHDTTPSGRHNHAAVWSGSEMIIWGGYGAGGFLNTGGRYDPATDRWTPTSIGNAPAGRSHHTAIWSGDKMIVWGGWCGDNVYLNTGGRYDPATDTWTPIATSNAPAVRADHTAIWSGTEMIIWGGNNSGGSVHLGTGGRYDPTTDTWMPTATTGAPSARSFHTAVWSGSEMIIWGGGYNGTYLDSGKRYNPITDTWTSTAAGGPDARQQHTAVWSGSEMIIWGGYNGSYLGSGKRYNPVANTWTTMSETPTARYLHSAVWSGTNMIIWGGYGAEGSLKTGGRYNPVANSWMPTSTNGAPATRHTHMAVWSGSEMIVWGGYEGSDSYTGGYYLNTGGRYDPVMDSWKVTTSQGEPTARAYHTAVWSGSEMIIWGGMEGNSTYVNTGGRYNPALNTWTPTTTSNAPTVRANHTAVWSGKRDDYLGWS